MPMEIQPFHIVALEGGEHVNLSRIAGLILTASSLALFLLQFTSDSSKEPYTLPVFYFAVGLAVLFYSKDRFRG